MDFSYYVQLAILFCFLPIFLLGKSLAIWMFLNTLQLVAHLPLLNTVMPANLHQFLRKYLDMVRLNIGGGFSSGQEIFQKQTISTSNEIYSNHNSILQLCGYGHIFSENAAVMLTVLGVISLIWLLFAIKQYACCFKKNLK